MKKVLNLFLLLFLISTSVQAQNPAQHIPSFTFYRLNDNPFTQKDIIAGKKVFFLFFDSNCEQCQHAIHEIGRHSVRFKKAMVYLVSLDGGETIKFFLTKYGAGIMNGANVTILQDRQNEFIAKFNPRKYPSMLLYSSQGKLINYEDDDNEVARIYNQL